MDRRFLEHTLANVQTEFIALRRLIQQAQTVDEIQLIRSYVKQMALDALGTEDTAAVKADVLARGVFSGAPR